MLANELTNTTPPQKTSSEWHVHDDAPDPNVLALAASYTPGSEEEKKFLRRIDRRIIVRFDTVDKSDSVD